MDLVKDPHQSGFVNQDLYQDPIPEILIDAPAGSAPFRVLTTALGGHSFGKIF